MYLIPRGLGFRGLGFRVGIYKSLRATIRDMGLGQTAVPKWEKFIYRDPTNKTPTHSGKDIPI